jgi:hypothetical protein
MALGVCRKRGRRRRPGAGSGQGGFTLEQRGSGTGSRPHGRSRRTGRQRASPRSASGSSRPWTGRRSWRTLTAPQGALNRRCRPPHPQRRSQMARQVSYISCCAAQLLTLRLRRKCLEQALSRSPLGDGHHCCVVVTALPCAHAATAPRLPLRGFRFSVVGYAITQDKTSVCCAC